MPVVAVRCFLRLVDAAADALLSGADSLTAEASDDSPMTGEDQESQRADEVVTSLGTRLLRRDRGSDLRAVPVGLARR